MTFNLDNDITNTPSEIIKYCPYCGALNHIPSCYVAGDTTGIIHCEYCGVEL